METTKILSDEMRGQKTTNFLIGLILALGLLFLGFEYTRRETKVIEDDVIYDSFVMEEDMIPITKQEVYVAPPPTAAPQTPEIINEVEDDVELPEEEVETTEEVNQAIVTTVVGTGTPTAGPSAPSGPVGPVIEQGGDDRIYESVEVQAEFPGGEEACLKWIAEHLKYPTICQEQGIQGRVQIQFVVNKDGSIVDIKVLRSPAPEMSTEAERVVKMMPKWKPARMNNQSVRSRFVLPILFRLG